LHLIPPVPLALTRIGIYHDVTRREGGGYRVTYTRPAWRFWQSGDQTFIAHPGDTIFCFFAIFSPASVRSTVRVRWLYFDPDKGRTDAGSFPVKISGGRIDGYRGFASKASYRPGDWQVRIETGDEREIGRINFTVEAAPPSAPAVNGTSIVL
jgi:hypothetical protein